MFSSLHLDLDDGHAETALPVDNHVAGPQTADHFHRLVLCEFETEFMSTRLRQGELKSFSHVFLRNRVCSAFNCGTFLSGSNKVSRFIFSTTLVVFPERQADDCDIGRLKKRVSSCIISIGKTKKEMMKNRFCHGNLTKQEEKWWKHSLISNGMRFKILVRYMTPIVTRIRTMKPGKKNPIPNVLSTFSRCETMPSMKFGPRPATTSGDQSRNSV